MHITNYNINKFSSKCVGEEDVEDVLKTNNATKRTLSAILEEINSTSNDKEATNKIRKNIDELCRKTAAALMSFILLFTNPTTVTSEE